VIVIEASAMVDALVDQPANPALLALIADSELHAPSVLDNEVASALRGHAKGGLLSDQRMADAADDFSALRIERYALAPMLRSVLALKDTYTVYDAAYIVLAQALDAPLVTADTKLVGARALGVDVQVLRNS
jgi:predicted nucleic acid-binding protein